MAMKFLKENWIVLSAGCVLTGIAIHCMKGIRGTEVIGGEIFIVPILLLLIGWIRQMKEDGIFDCLLYDDEEDEDDDF